MRVSTVTEDEDKLPSDAELDQFLQEEKVTTAAFMQSAEAAFRKEFVGDRDNRRHY